MRVIFAGTPEFARIALERIHAAGHSVTLVLTQPDRPAGRGMKMQASAVKQFALEHAIALAQPRSLRLDGKYPEEAAATRAAIQNAQAHVMVVAAYGLLLPQWVLQDMGQGKKLGCINIHASLLPRWRGAAPIHRAIEAGDTHTGVTIMQMDSGLDTGDVLLSRSVPIEAQDTTASLHDALADMGADMVLQALALGAAGQLQPEKQAIQGVTYAHKIEKQEATIDWQLHASSIVQRVRAFNPFPVAHTSLHGEVLKIWSACIDSQPPVLSKHACGEVLSVEPRGISVGALDSAVLITQLQRPGGKRLDAASLVHGFDIRAGMRFEV